MGPVVLEHVVDEPVVSQLEDFGPAFLGHKVDTLVSLGRRDFVPNALSRQDSEPVDLGNEDSGPTTSELDLDPALARVDLVDMYTRVAAALVGFAVARVELVVTKFVLGSVEVGPARVWVERCAEHITSVAALLAATIVRIDLVVVVGDLAAR